MRSTTFFLIATVLMGLASQAFAHTCDAVQATDSLPPANGVSTAVLNAKGVRIWDCKDGELVDPKQIDGTANFTGTYKDEAATGGFVYINDIARFTLTVDGVSTQFDLDDKPALTNRTGTLADARWTVNWVEDPPAGLVGDSYLTRTDSDGGVTPTKCNSLTDKTIEVPYTTTYTMYTCEEEAKAGSAAPRASVAALASAVVVAAAVGIFA